MVGGLVFVHWLIGQSLYRIGALCPYCMAVWVATIAVSWYTTLHNLTAARLPLPPSWQRMGGRVARYHGALLTAWLMTIAGGIAIRFWPDWAGLLS